MESGTLNRIPSGSRIALDTVPFVYFLERHPDFFRPAQSLFDQIEEGRIEAFASTLVLTELLAPAFRENAPIQAQDAYRLLTHFPNLTFIDLTPPIAFEAARLRGDSSLRTPDALHLATALELEADWFVTNDKAFSKLKNLSLKVWLFSGA